MLSFMCENCTRLFFFVANSYTYLIVKNIVNKTTNTEKIQNRQHDSYTNIKLVVTISMTVNNKIIKLPLYQNAYVFNYPRSVEHFGVNQFYCVCKYFNIIKLHDENITVLYIIFIVEINLYFVNNCLCIIA